ncbi:hypothetical protein NHX12_009299 [Muraenolepis orangiensis]|uniref:Myb/SANT-like DNA-binding domain-containing protein n=1 Tax=Muraenolepis orangiensis TaxID=630683 RepID=A0A9Q0IA77_9TELE|nr:hypothetical protein NHX12_009299 [Muraenolepis orangiensis]
MSGTSRQHWPLGETQALLNLWAEDGVQRQMEGVCRNEEVIQYMVDQLSKMGIQRTTVQIREKLKKLRQQYKAVKRDETKTFPFFDLMDSVLGDKGGLHMLDADQTIGFRKRRSESDDPTQGFVSVMAECHRRWLEKEEELRREEMQQEAQLRREEMEQELILRREEGEREERLRHKEMEARSKDTETLSACLMQTLMAKDPPGNC